VSPHPSVHEDQLRQIEEQSRRSRARRRPGCFSLCVLVVLLGLVGLAWWKRDVLFQDGRFRPGNLFEHLAEQGKELRETSPKESLARLRRKVSDIQERWEELARKNEIEKRLQSLREDLEEKRRKAAASAGENWDRLVTKSEELIEKAQEKGKKVPRDG